MDKSGRGWRRGSKGGKSDSAEGGSGKGWQSRKQPTAKTGVSRHRTWLLSLGLAAISLLAIFIVVVLRIPRDMPLVVFGVTAYDRLIPPNAFVEEDTQRLASTNPDNINLMVFKQEITRESLKRHLKDSLHPGGFVKKELITIYLSAHGVVDRQGRACLLLSDSKPVDESTWFLISELFEILDVERPDAVKIVLLDSGKIDANWSLGILYNDFPDRVAEQLSNHRNIFVVTDRASGQLAWSAPERKGTIFGHFVASGLSAAADFDGSGSVSLREFYRFVSAKVDAWVSDNRSSRQTPLLMPQPTGEQDIELVSSGAGPGETGSPKDHVAKLASAWRNDLQPLWMRYEAFVRETGLLRHEPLGLAALEADLLRAEQLLLAGSTYQAEYTETLKNAGSLMSAAAKPSLPGKLRGFSLPLAAQLELGFDPATSGKEVLAEWQAAGGWPKDKEGQEKSFSLSYLEAANVANRWLLAGSSEPGGTQLRDALRLIDASSRHIDDKGLPIEHVQETQLLKLALQFADAHDADSWPPALRVALREALQTQAVAEQIAAPADERVHYWVQPLMNSVDELRRQALDSFFIGNDISLAAAREQFARCRAENAAKAQTRLDEVSAAYELRDRVWARLPYVAFWSSQHGRLDAQQPDLAIALRRADELSTLLNADDTTRPLEFDERHQAVVSDLRAAWERLEREFGDHLANLLKSSPASGTLLKAHHLLRTPLATARDREVLFLGKYLASMELDYESQERSKTAPTTEPAQLTRWPAHPAVLLVRQDDSAAVAESNAVAADSKLWFSSQGGLVRDGIEAIPKRKLQLEQESDQLLRSEQAAATARRTRLGLAKADDTARAAAMLLGRRPWSTVTDPTRRLRYVDRHFQLLWHSHRLLDDFWGPTVSLRRLPYFANVADAYLNGAKELAPNSVVLGHANEPDLTRLRDRRVAATAIGIDTDSELKCYEAEETRPQILNVNWTADLPPGQAAVFVTVNADNDASQLFPVLAGASQVRRRGAVVHEAASRIEHSLQLTKPASGTSLPFSANVLYRGHAQSARFAARWPKYTIPVRAEMAHPEAAEVTVAGDAERIGYIMFIVDCSGSMDQRGRMNRAVDSLRHVLDELGNQPNYAIGLRAYGRKAGFVLTPDGNNYVRDDDGNYVVRRLLAAGKYDTVSAPDPLGLHPDDDADDLLEPLGLRESQADAIRERIKELRPNGVTPLYKALTTSLTKDFTGRRAAQDEGNTKHIVLITDGEDFSSKRPALGKMPVPTSASDVLTAWNRSGSDVQIHIIFLDPQSEVPAELKQIPAKTGGIYRGANELDELVRGIREAIGLVEFSVDTPGRSDSNKRKYHLAETAEVTALRQEQEVLIHGALGGKQPNRKIYLDGGEAIKLIYEHPLNRIPRLVFPIEDPRSAYSDAPVVSGFTRDGERHEFVIRAHRPEVHSADVDFFVSVQDITGTTERDNRTEHFTPPIRQVWCEIAPVVGRTALPEQRYYFYDVDHVQDEPIPKLRFHAKNWPRPATRAHLKLWFSFDRFRRTPSGFQGIKIEESGGSKLFSVPGLEDVAFEAAGQELSLDEPYRYRLTIDESNTPLGAVAIIVSPPANAVSHTYYSFETVFGGTNTAHHHAKHVYEFEKPTTVEIDVVTSDQFKKDPRVIAVPQLDVLIEE